MTTSMSTHFRFVFAALLAAISASSAVAQETSSAPSTVSETYRDWVVVCRNVPTQDNKPGSRLCEMTQELRQQESRQRVLVVALRRVDKVGGGLITILTPFGLKVSSQVAIEIGGAPVLQAPFQTCMPAGCLVQTQIEKTALDAMLNSESAVVRLPTTAGEALKLSVSLLGFSAAWNRLSEL